MLTGSGLRGGERRICQLATIALVQVARLVDTPEAKTIPTKNLFQALTGSLQ